MNDYDGLAASQATGGEEENGGVEGHLSTQTRQALIGEIIGNQFGEKITLGRVLRMISDRRLKMTDWTDVWGQIVIEMRQRVCTGSGNSGWAVGRFSC
jgi:hypothetical protein